MCALITLTRLLWFSFPRLLNGPEVSVVASHSRKCCLMKSVRPSQFALAKKRSSRGVESDLSQRPPSLESTQPQRVRETRIEPWQVQMIPGHASLSSPRNGAEAVSNITCNRKSWETNISCPLRTSHFSFNLGHFQVIIIREGSVA